MDAAAARSGSRILLVSALGVGQLVAWGSFYYVFVSLTDPMADEFGWTKTQISGALSVVLAITGLCSYARGRWIDRYGGRPMMTVAAFVGAALLFAWAHITELWQLYAISVGIGIVSAMTALRRRVRRGRPNARRRLPQGDHRHHALRRLGQHRVRAADPVPRRHARVA